MTCLVLLSFYGSLSLITFCFYGADKHGKQRIRESTLHLLSLFGGWFGALLGQKVFRHKTKKWHFLLVFWLTVVVNVTMMGYAVYFFQFS
ncbi:MAG: DUF1294 domain-containing protein [Gammaproteobacteria bacterium]|nr:DUF1294 domain-containing protein [Gammaproteobacteria bacterium]MBU1466993.1 DUF1294 domain-containing protein [Gammaproteobacteria bacterium]MBU2023554.1 DUF1294 domain-containing protein [Gammaproteobacteria bacterium]MBU2237194.1 DUF1294 domain-containing protein [Gammaproteobacteria bacterium]MBU2317184.1 DUF1294 domain-containing protein [Gammaproteobacteria bacterium]